MPNDIAMSAIRKHAEQADDAWMSVRQAGLALGCAPQTVYAKAIRGELETTRFAGRTFVSRASVERALTGAGA